jgi:hypothetical protein
MDFKWTINKLHIDKDGLVVEANVTVTGTDGNNTASADYAKILKRGDSFIPYEQLTEQQVLDWCFAVENFRADGEAQVAGQIARQLAQKQSEPNLPWKN